MTLSSLSPVPAQVPAPSQAPASSPPAPSSRSQATPLSRARLAAWLLAILCAAFALRVPAALRQETIFRDTIQYVALARAVHLGAWDRVWSHGYPPGYAAGVAGLAALQGADPGRAGPRSRVEGGLPVRSEAEDRIYIRSARCLSALLGALSALPVFWIGRRLGGARAGLWSAGLLALQPWHATISRAGLSEPTFLWFDLLALACAVDLAGDAHVASWRRRGLAAAGLAGAAGMAYLVRPEVLAVVLAAVAIVALGRGRRRAAVALALSIPILTLGAVYAWKLSALQGRLVLTPKKDLLTLAMRVVQHPGAWLGAFGGNLLRAAEVGHPLIVALSVLGLWSLRRTHSKDRRPGARPAALVIALAAALHLAAAATVRVDPRFGLAVATLLLPAAGLGCCRVVEVLGRVRSLGRPRARRLLLVAALGSTLPVYLHKASPKKPSYQEAAVRLAKEARRLPGGATLYAEDPRLPYAAGLPWAAPRPGRRGPEELVRVLSKDRVALALVALAGRSARRWPLYQAALRAMKRPLALRQIARIRGPETEVWLGRVVRAGK